MDKASQHHLLLLAVRALLTAPLILRTAPTNLRTTDKAKNWSDTRVCRSQRWPCTSSVTWPYFNYTKTGTLQLPRIRCLSSPRDNDLVDALVTSQWSSFTPSLRPQWKNTTRQVDHGIQILILGQRMNARLSIRILVEYQPPESNGVVASATVYRRSPCS